VFENDGSVCFGGWDLRNFFTMKSTVGIFFNEISSANVFAMKSASMNSALEIVFKLFQKI
jgi:hypothetical protein